MKTFRAINVNKFLFQSLFSLLLLLLLSPIFTLIFSALGGLGLFGIPRFDAGLSVQSAIVLSLNSFKLIVMTLLGAGSIGLCSALIVTQFDFPFRRTLSWLLMLPLAVPAYIIAFAYTDMLDYAGPIQVSLRAWLGYHSPRDYWFPQVRSYLGAALMLSFVLYPYVYLFVRTALLQQSQNAIDAARLMGDTHLARFYKVTLPLLRPALFASLALVAMETLADFGTVNYFGLSVLTKGLYDLVQNRADLHSAAQLALMALSLVFVIFTLESYFRARTQALRSAQPLHSAIKVSPLFGWLLVLLCLIPVLLGLIIPLAYLLSLANSALSIAWNSALRAAIINSSILACWVSAAIVLLALLFSLTHRLSSVRSLGTLGQLISLGYAIPGLMLGLSVLILQRLLDPILLQLAPFFGFEGNRILTGSIGALMLALILRFFALGYNNISSELSLISRSVDYASKVMGDSSLRTSLVIFTPLLNSSILGAALLVLVETMKELPASLLLRPAGFQTMATFVYDKASTGLITQSALGAVAIIALGLIPTIFLILNSERKLKSRKSAKKYVDLS